MLRDFKELLGDSEGATTLEYAIAAAFIAATCAATVGLLGQGVAGLFIFSW